jgi:carbonic anhydrase
MCKSCDNSFPHDRDDLPRRRFLALLGAALSTPLALRAAEKGPPPKPQNVISADDALNRLMIGNSRYVSGTSRRHNFATQRAALTKGQNPFAAILSCADSRVGPEYAFDTGVGDLFVCRVAGNFANDDVVASFEYAVSVLSTPLIFVLGHQACGAVDATVKQIKDRTAFPGHIPSLTEALTPAVNSASDQPGDLLTNAIKRNVLLTVQKLQTTGPILSQAVREKKVKIAGGIYNLHTGKVDLASS